MHITPRSRLILIVGVGLLSCVEFVNFAKVLYFFYVLADHKQCGSHDYDPSGEEIGSLHLPLPNCVQVLNVDGSVEFQEFVKSLHDTIWIPPSLYLEGEDGDEYIVDLEKSEFQGSSSQGKVRTKTSSSDGSDSSNREDDSHGRKTIRLLEPEYLSSVKESNYAEDITLNSIEYDLDVMENDFEFSLRTADIRYPLDYGPNTPREKLHRFYNNFQFLRKMMRDIQLYDLITHSSFDLVDNVRSLWDAEYRIIYNILSQLDIPMRLLAMDVNTRDYIVDKGIIL
jgi:hypothetical protein